MRWVLALMVACTSPPIDQLDAHAPPAATVPVDAASCTPRADVVFFVHGPLPFDIADCCSLAPDEQAVTECVLDRAPIGVCGVCACHAADCTQIRVSFGTDVHCNGHP